MLGTQSLATGPSRGGGHFWAVTPHPPHIVGALSQFRLCSVGARGVGGGSPCSGQTGVLRWPCCVSAGPAL